MNATLNDQMTTQDRQIAALRHELSQEKRQNQQLGEKVQMQFLALAAERPQGVREGI